MRSAAVLLVACFALPSCGGGDIPSPRGTVPGEWVAEAWLSTDAWVQREMFPCHICYGFHGQSPDMGGPEYLLADDRISVTCPECAGTGFRRCKSCDGKGGAICDICEGFGDVRCDNPKCSLVRVDDTVSAPASQDLVYSSVGCPDCEWKGGDCPECRVGRPNLAHLSIPDRGEVRLTSREPCPTCRSRGILDCPSCSAGFRECSACRGAGFERNPCPRCLGQGQMHPRRIEFERKRIRLRSDEK